MHRFAAALHGIEMSSEMTLSCIQAYQAYSRQDQQSGPLAKIQVGESCLMLLNYSAETRGNTMNLMKQDCQLYTINDHCLFL